MALDNAVILKQNAVIVERRFFRKTPLVFPTPNIAALLAALF
ncbi:hypothetical protein CCACVL1_02348 [Corchorus capsularis]|uniref:Uncharacterized protein n=1 Tax=Corchorus capsularis TaxID=210143 RepID=A0A1R3K927_COCAP|nr:hypothetical protein CCACVL1_02348 [Corchorus capsularis]